MLIDWWLNVCLMLAPQRYQWYQIVRSLGWCLLRLVGAALEPGTCVILALAPPPKSVIGVTGPPKVDWKSTNPSVIIALLMMVTMTIVMIAAILNMIITMMVIIMMVAPILAMRMITIIVVATGYWGDYGDRHMWVSCGYGTRFDYVI